MLVGIVAILLSGILPAGSSCVLAEAVDHACCAAPEPAPTSSCCSTVNDSDAEQRAGQNLGCDCAHPTETPVILSVSGVTDDPVRAMVSESESAALHGAPDAEARTRDIERRVRSHPPPPAFLLDCAFLT